MLTHLRLRGIRTAALCIAAAGLHMMLSLLYSNAATQENWNTGWGKKKWKHPENTGQMVSLSNDIRSERMGCDETRWSPRAREEERERCA